LLLLGVECCQYVQSLAVMQFKDALSKALAREAELIT